MPIILTTANDKFECCFLIKCFLFLGKERELPKQNQKQRKKQQWNVLIMGGEVELQECFILGGKRRGIKRVVGIIKERMGAIRTGVLKEKLQSKSM